MLRLDTWKKVSAAFLLCVATAIAAPAQVTFATLVRFDRKNGANPSSLVQGADGSLYGTTANGGANCTYGYGVCGTVFKITPQGRLTTLYNFCELTGCADGGSPDGPLLQATNGQFYGTTGNGGGFSGDDCGTVFEMSADGTLTTLQSFDGQSGCGPSGGLIQAANGDLYGATQDGGDNGGGTVFKVTEGGTLTTLYSFCSPDCGAAAPASSLVQATDGNLYGTTSSGGATNNEFCTSTGCGTIFKITPAGVLTALYAFCSLPSCADGSTPEAPLIQATDGNFYGTTYEGGANCATNFGCGTVFKITPNGKLTTLYSFCSLPDCADGAEPDSLRQATDGNFYGTTFFGGANCGRAGCGYGTVFEITPTGTLTTLYSFCSLTNCTDGALPSGLLQSTSGIFYGTTAEGGAGDHGTVFTLSTALGPFVSLVRNPAKVGQEFGILGQGLTGTTSVSLNGTPASFTIKSGTLLTATVPAGATTGYVTVTTTTGTLTSNVRFYVIP